MLIRRLRRELPSLCGALFASSVLAGVEFRPTSVGFEQSGNVTKIEYVLEKGPAIVTLAIQTNTLVNGAGEWLEVDGQSVQALRGDVNRVVRDVGTVRTIEWRARKDIPDIRLGPGQIRAVLTAWATNAPPDWMVVGLTEANDVRFYASTNYLPHGFSSDYYRTSAMLMRRIPAAGKVWTMGTPADEGGLDRNADAEIQHLVALTEDYYMGVYEVTQGQYANMCDKRDASYWNKRNPDLDESSSDYWAALPDSGVLPVDTVGLKALRGQSATFDDPSVNLWFPRNGHQVTDDSVIGQVRAKTGLTELDLPTYAQWEFACRAGTTGARNVDSVSVNDLAWTYNNAGTVREKSTGSRYCPSHPVGSLLPNAWLLFDMLGNVSEYCLGRYPVGVDYRNTFAVGWERGSVTVDPDDGLVVSTSPENECCPKAGGSSEEGPGQARSGARGFGGWNYAYHNMGFRLWHPAIVR